MGAWGTGVFSTDISLDVKDDYLNALKAGRTDQEAEDYVMRLADTLDDEEFCAFYTALAMIQWKYGRLSEKIRNMAIQTIDDGGDCELFLSKTDIEKRKKALNECKKALLLPPPEKKKIKLAKPLLAPWTAGDVFAYKISDKNPQNIAMFGKYFVFLITFVKHREHEFKEFNSDEVHFVVLNRAYTDIPSLEELEVANFLRFCEYHKECVEQLSWVSERPLKNFMKQTTFIGRNDNVPPLQARSVAWNTFLQNIENTLVEVYQNKKLNAKL